jgi:hypothetical protein
MGRYSALKNNNISNHIKDVSQTGARENQIGGILFIKHLQPSPREMDSSRYDDIPKNSAHQRICDCKPGRNQRTMEPITCDLCPLTDFQVSPGIVNVVTEKTYVKCDWN